MKIFKLTLLLLAICVAKNDTTKKLDNILKKVGKRYQPRLPALQKLMNERKILRDWKEKDQEYVDSVKTKLAEEISMNIRWQSSFRDERWSNHAELLMEAQDDKMMAEVCDSKDKMNKYQFDKFLAKKRLEFLNVDNKAPYYYKVAPTENDILKLHIKFDLSSRWGFNTTMIWDVEFRYKVIDEVGSFKIVHITVGGGCTEHGTVNHNYTNLNIPKTSLDKLKKENNVDVKALFDIFVPGSLKYLEQSNGDIPSIWLEALEVEEELLEASVCSHLDTHIERGYSREAFISWYEHFKIMWHPKENDTDYIQVQMLDMKENEMTARITMRLQIGIQKNVSTHDWNFMMRLSYNQHGDAKWYITKLNVLCVATINLMDESLKHIRDIVTDNFLTVVRKLPPPPVPWYSTVEFVKKFTVDGDVDADICDDKDIKNLTQIQLSFWTHRGYYKNTTIVLYKVDYTDIPLPAAESTYFHMNTITSPNRREPYGWLYEQDWTFRLKWDRLNQFYFIEKLELTCPHLVKTYRGFHDVDTYIRF